ncbi:HesB/YadR/YfhF family protein [Paenibacillus beijingensis]|uniref:FeS cluster biogenesis domain-containing protein n=1 Tax=Paenibacillus beijingensis TaxID=1126833 RepID=A0A0D5NNU6_9BACL|nr:hypothetical protein [Paenibacillus beijingensis]AJY76994.1 hypothetical protein VN24_23595 [Paenibacillus beijingensis]
MKITVEQSAARWYKNELALNAGDQLQIFVRLGGCGSVQPGLSLGVIKAESNAPRIRQTAEDVEFYMLEDHLWYLDNKDLHIRFDEKQEEVSFDVM